MPDKVMRPQQKGNTAGVVKQVNRGPISGPTGSASTVNPFNRKKKR